MENKTMKKNIKQGIKKALKKEELEKAEWEYFEDETEYSPRVEATTTINGYKVTVGYVWYASGDNAIKVNFIDFH